MDIISAATLLFLVMDPLGNIPVFLSVLDDVAPERRTRVLIHELFLALIVLVAGGNISVRGGIIMRPVSERVPATIQ